MSKVFAFHKGSNKEDWFSSTQYGDKEIKAIVDPEGGSEISLPTAIPSPFARIDLVKTAFANINATPQLRTHLSGGDVIASKEDERLVSYTLDLIELIFNIDSVKDQVRIIVWDKETELNNLRQGLPEHKRLAEVLAMYLEKDSVAYNFYLYKRIYIIEYKHRVIGATSSATLFFPSNNELDFARQSFSQTNNLFDAKNYTPLYRRADDFQIYVYQLFKSNPILKSHLKVIDTYLKNSLKILEKENHRLWDAINRLESDYEKRYETLNSGSNLPGVEVLGVQLRKRKRKEAISSILESDFVIKSNKFPGYEITVENGERLKVLPLVLQHDHIDGYKYINNPWDINTKVPFKDEENDVKQRKLPGYNIKFPYLTVSDFLEPYIIRTVFPINKESYFDGNLSVSAGVENKGYLLPLTPLFFEFFSSEELKKPLFDGKQRIEIEQGNSGSVKVILRIPISRDRGYVVLERKYRYYDPERGDVHLPDEYKNDGIVVENQFGVTIFPFIKCKEELVKPHYRVQLVDRNIVGLFKHQKLGINFYVNQKAEPISIRSEKERSSKKADDISSSSSNYYVLDEEFDFLQVYNDTTRGFVIPNWRYYEPGAAKYTFAVDFGTTNTHVEFKVDDNKPEAFKISNEDLQIAPLFDPERTDASFGGSGANAIRELIDHEFIPLKIGDGANYYFPQRTVIGESHSLRINQETYTLADFNIPFVYEKAPDKVKLHTNLKWAKKEAGNEKRIKAFFEKLIMMMRAKVMIKRGNLKETKLVWFYPSSMTQGRIDDISKIWKDLFKEYFNNENEPVGITESLAPFYYYRDDKLLGGSYKPVVSIDIGGGTSDVVIFQKNEPIVLTSFRFAANSVFGDGFSEFGGASHNGFLYKYYRFISDLLSENGRPDLEAILESIKGRSKSEDVNTFLFSLENNKTIKNQNQFSYNNLLSRDEDLKIVFILFYASIVYHVAVLMKFKGIERPRNIAFSGTGSKILSIITPNEQKLEKLSKIIFDEVYGGVVNEEIKVVTEKLSPKEVTSKGGLMVDAEDATVDLKQIKTVLVVNSTLNLEKVTHREVNEEVKQHVVGDVHRFIKLLEHINTQYDFNEYFNASYESISILKEESSKHLREYLEQGIEYMKKLDPSLNEDRFLDETLFFYPIIGLIKVLVNRLSQLNPVNA